MYRYPHRTTRRPDRRWDIASVATKMAGRPRPSQIINDCRRSLAREDLDRSEGRRAGRPRFDGPLLPIGSGIGHGGSGRRRYRTHKRKSNRMDKTCSRSSVWDVEGESFLYKGDWGKERDTENWAAHSRFESFDRARSGRADADGRRRGRRRPEGGRASAGPTSQRARGRARDRRPRPSTRGARVVCFTA